MGNLRGNARCTPVGVACIKWCLYYWAEWYSRNSILGFSSTSILGFIVRRGREKITRLCGRFALLKTNLCKLGVILNSDTIDRAVMIR